MEEELIKCKLCNYQSDKRLMLEVFDPSTEYSKKIEKYLAINISPTNPSSICFHCSQTLDNFHNFAVKIQAIQKILNPEVIKEKISIEVLEVPQITVITRSSHKKSEKAFEELKKESFPQFSTLQEAPVDETLSELQSHRSFDLNEIIEESCDEIDEIKGDLRDPDDEDFPSAESLKKIPQKLIENGSLIYKGKKLMKFLSIFFNTACKLCEIPRFPSISSLFQHYKESHQETEPFVTCCSTKFTKMPKIIWHFVQHIEPDAFKCNLCDYSVSRPKFLAIHMQNHLPGGEKPLQCDQCDKRFIWKGALKTHLLNHQSNRPEFICDICQRVYQTAGSLSSHRKSAHIENLPKTRKLCEICSKSFSTFTAYKEHLQLHSEDRDKMQLKCPDCSKWLKNKRCLRAHLLLHTSDEFKCEICEYSTKKSKLLENHMMTKHNDEKTFKCTENGCDKSFKVKRALSIHLQQHHSGKNSARKCEFCGREFASSTNYYTHRKNQHKRELQEAKEKKIEEEKLRRIKAGLEDFNVSGGGSRVTIIEQEIFESRDEPIVITLSADAFVDPI